MHFQKTLFLLLPFAATSVAQAQLGGLSVKAAMFGTPVIYEKYATTGPLSATGDFDLTGFYDFDAAGFADYGQLGALARGNRADNFTGGISGDTLLVESLFQDAITFSISSGQFKLVFEVEGLLTVNGVMSTTSAVRLTSSINNSSVLYWEKSLDHDDSPSNTLAIEEVVFTEWVGFSGSDFENVFVKLSAQIVPDGFLGPFIASSEFLNTVKLAYIEVVDGSGNPLNATAVSSSGAGYSVNTGTIPPDPLPVLALQIEGGSIVLSWSAAFPDYHPESVPSLSPVDDWNPVTTPPLLVEGRNVVTMAFEGGSRFYRLKRE